MLMAWQSPGSTPTSPTRMQARRGSTSATQAIPSPRADTIRTALLLVWRGPGGAPARAGGHWGSGGAVSGSCAYVADGNSGLQVIDVSNPASPQRVGGYDTSGTAYGVTVSGNCAYVADFDSGLRVIDVSDPAHPQQVGSYVPYSY